MEFLADGGTFFPIVSSEFQPGSGEWPKVFVVEAKGSLKEKAGQVTNRPNLTAEGKTEKIAGKVQKEVGQIEEVLEK
jgi:uncharacterized protein YjbJ (UPF0337 family)